MPDNLPDLKDVRILVVDDDVDTLEFLDFLLQDYGAQVRTTVSAHEALEVFSEWSPQVLVSDIGMPEVDGYMLMRKIRTMPLGQPEQLQAIALTAYAGELNHHQTLEAGFHKHVTKPVDPDEFIALIAAVVKESKIPLL
ncbi:response regulator [Aetokthonos hydrillicola CCALA 1050]|nr:response regulator [Aetokthonos hydrillicola CCALA 1050]